MIFKVRNFYSVSKVESEFVLKEEFFREQFSNSV